MTQNTKAQEFLKIVEPYMAHKTITKTDISITLKDGVFEDQEKYGELLLKAVDLGATRIYNPKPGFLIPLALAKEDENKLLYLHETDLEDGGPQPRLDISPGSLQGLYEDIKVRGQRDPIKVYPSPTTPGKYRVRDGHCRKTVIFNMLRKDGIWAINEKRSDLEAFEDAFTLNYQRKSLSSYELGAFILKLKELFPDTYPNQETIGKKLGLSQEAISRIMTAYGELEKSKDKINPDVMPHVIRTSERSVNKIRNASADLRPKLLETVAEKDLSVLDTEKLVEGVNAVEGATERTVTEVADALLKEKAEAFRADGEKIQKNTNKELQHLIDNAMVPAPEALVRDAYGRNFGEKVSQGKLNLLLSFLFKVMYEHLKNSPEFNDYFEEARQEALKWQ